MRMVLLLMVLLLAKKFMMNYDGLRGLLACYQDVGGLQRSDLLAYAYGNDSLHGVVYSCWRRELFFAVIILNMRALNLTFLAARLS